MIFRHHPLAEQRHRRADGKLAVELDGQRVHRDRADDAAPLAFDPDFGSCHVAAEAVRIPDRDDPDPGGLLGHETAAVPGAFARRKPPNLSQYA